MSIVCAAIKNDEIAIAADTQLSSGSININADELKNAGKLYKVGENVLGIVGWNAVSTLYEHVAQEHSDMFELADRNQIYKTLLKLQKLLKDEYFLETSEHSRQPVESIQLDALVVNKNGIFEINSYREVNQYNHFWAMGSGRELALGAMHVLYESNISAENLALKGVEAAAKFDDSCSLPSTSEVMNMEVVKRIALIN